MKFLIITLFAVLVVAAQSQEETEIDWSIVKPISEHPELKDDHQNYTPTYISNGNRRIIGGKQAQKFQFPYQAGIWFTPVDKVNPNLRYLGGGSLISSTRVLTAAHNIEDIQSALVVLGADYILIREPAQVRINVPLSEIVVHPQFNFETHQNDIAILKLPSAVEFNNYISPIALPEGSNDYVGVTAIISGWGDFDITRKQSRFLRFATMNVISNSECDEEYDDITDSIICAQGAGDVSGCEGDSGGPLAIQSNGKPILVGVISFVSECRTDFPTGCARVTSYLPWIKSNM